MIKVRFAEAPGPRFPRMVPLVGAACVALAGLLSGTIASADPVRIVTSGSFYQIPEDGETSFSLFGDGFAISGGDLWSTFFETCNPSCTPGSMLNLSATMSPSPFQPEATATVDGQVYSSIFLTGDFDFAAGSVVVPDIPPGTFNARVGTGFTFTGTLSGYADSSQTGSPFFTLLLIGSGTGNASFRNIAASPGIYVDGFNYEFDPTAPVPEPGSLLLFGSGAAWVAARRRLSSRRPAARSC